MAGQNVQGTPQQVQAEAPVEKKRSKGKPHKVLMPKEKAKDLNLEERRKTLQVTKVKEIDDPKLEEIELNSVWEPYNMVRILYNRQSNEYIYEVIEPELTPDEEATFVFIKTALIKTMEYRFEDVDIKRSEKEEYLRMATMSILSSINLRLDETVKERLMYYIIRDFAGYGIIDILMLDEMIEDVSCDGPGIPLFVYHKKYESMRSNIIFEDDHQLDGFVISLAQRCGKHISVADPMLDATIPDGSRLQATLAREITTRGSSFTIRRFRENPFTPPDLLRLKTLSAEMIAYLWLAVEHGESMMLCGGTACGKTSTMNAILLFVPSAMKIITIEDTREINLPHENWIAGLTRERKGTAETAGKSIDMYALLVAALRQRPEYMLVGEVRGKETMAVFQAMATGQVTYSTIHADSVTSIVRRLENPPINIPRILILGLNLIILQAQVRVKNKRTRRIKELVEIIGIDPTTNEIITNTVFKWIPAKDEFKYTGHSKLYEKIMDRENMTADEVLEDVKQRAEVIEWMVERDVRSHREVASIINEYYREPIQVITRVRREMKEFMAKKEKEESMKAAEEIAAEEGEEEEEEEEDEYGDEFLGEEGELEAM